MPLSFRNTLVAALLAGANIASLHALSADFEGGAGTTAPNQIPGIGGDGWTVPWSSGNLGSGNSTITAADTPPLSPGGGTHLRATVTATNADSGVGRTFSTTDSVAGIDPTKPATFSFEFRLDASNSGFTSSSEYITLNGNNGLVSSSGSSTWMVQVLGGTAPRWWCYNGGRDGGSFSSARLVDTGIAVTPGTTYTFSISVDPPTRTYSVTISGSGNSATVNGLGFRTSATALGNTFGIFARKNASGDMLAFALDRLLISGTRPPAPPTPPESFSQVFDMVGHTPGEPYYASSFNDPTYTRDAGFTGKVFSLFESPLLAVNWDAYNTPDKVILPVGSPDRAWVDAKRAEILPKLAAAKAAGLKVYAMSDLILLPKRIVSLHGLTTTLGNINNADTELWLRRNLQLMFEQFPDLDGLMVRIGETYLNDAPYHQGKIDTPWSTTTITPLMNILRDEVCVKLGKQIYFRTWNSFDTNLSTFLAVSNAVEPHPNLIWSIKHVEGDFHRGNPYSKVLGQGRHPFIVEVQSAREYEGKGAYPNYIANGVIEGFEEHASNPAQSLRHLWLNSPLMRGVWTWSRGGGWRGPYIQNEFWCELNTWVMAQWALAPATPESELFSRFATTRLGLPAEQVPAFRRLCLLSAEAIWRWKRGTNNGLVAGWSRDHYYTFPDLPASAAARDIVLTSQDEAVARFEEIVSIAATLTPSDPADRAFILSSSEYGLRLLRFLRAVVRLEAAEVAGDAFQTKVWMDRHDEAWADYQRLPTDFPSGLSSLYIKNAWQTWGGENPTTAEPRLRAAASAALQAALSTDSDADGHSDAEELGLYWDQPFDTDADGTPDRSQASVHPRAYETWTQQQFQRSFDQPTIAGQLANPDNDAFPNLIEFALKGDPLAANAQLTTLVPVSGGAAPAMEFSPTPRATDLELVVETTAELSGWLPVARSTGGAPFIALVPGWSVGEGSLPGSARLAPSPASGSGNLFYRISATRLPP